jgi:hypothetical protein
MQGAPRTADAFRANKKRRQERAVPDAFVRLRSLDYHSVDELSIKTGKFLKAENQDIRISLTSRKGVLVIK